MGTKAIPVSVENAEYLHNLLLQLEKSIADWRRKKKRTIDEGSMLKAFEIHVSSIRNSLYIASHEGGHEVNEGWTCDE